MSTTTLHHAAPQWLDYARHRCVLAITRLAPDVMAVAVADIFKGCRERHRALSVTGTMLFDGERFGYLLCGGEPEVGEAFDAITADPRQALPVVLADGTDIPSWAVRGWRGGWCEPDALGDLPAAAGGRQDIALQAWRGMLATSDLL